MEHADVGATRGVQPRRAALCDERAAPAGDGGGALARLQALYDKAPTLDLLQAIAMLQPDDGSRRERLLAHLREHPSLGGGAGAARRVDGGHEPRAVAPAAPIPPHGSAASGLGATEAGAVRDAVRRAARPLHRYRCAACGFEAEHYFWQCPGCLGWDTYPPQRLEDL